MTQEAAADLIELAHAIERFTPSTTDSALLEAELAGRLYRSHYCRPSRFGGLHGSPPDRDFVASLGEANEGTGTLDSGFTLVERREDVCIVQKHGVEFWVAPDQVSEIGGRLRVSVPKEMNAFAPGFYFFLGNAVDDARPEDSAITRFYWHLAEAGATAFVRAVSATLNDAGIAFTAKVLRQPGTFTRADAAVLYLKRSVVIRAMPGLCAIHRRVRPFLRKTTPMFTLPLGAGLAIADDPGEPQSFGQHRCRLVARGLLAAFDDGVRTREGRLAHIIRSFESENVCPRNTHLRSIEAEPYPAFELVE